MDKNGFGGVEKMCQFCKNKIQHHENPYQHLVFRVVDDLNLTLPSFRKNTILLKRCKRLPKFPPDNLFHFLPTRIYAKNGEKVGAKVNNLRNFAVSLHHKSNFLIVNGRLSTVK